jgi:hypothetical protein
MYEDLRVKLKMHWRCQEVGDPKNMEHLLRKGVGSDYNLPKREAMCAKTGNP